MAEEPSPVLAPPPPSAPPPARGDLPARVARLLVQRRRAIHLATLGLLLVCGLIVAFGAHFSSDVLDLFPQKFDSVRVWKTSNREFAQGRSLTFAFLDEKQECDLEDFARLLRRGAAQGAVGGARDGSAPARMTIMRWARRRRSSCRCC